MAAAMDRSDTLSRLAATIASRRGADPSTSWVAKLHARGVPVIARKLGVQSTWKSAAELSDLGETADAPVSDGSDAAESATEKAGV